METAEAVLLVTIMTKLADKGIRTTSLTGGLLYA